MIEMKKMMTNGNRKESAGDSTSRYPAADIGLQLGNKNQIQA